MPPRVTAQRAKKVQQELDALYEQRALTKIEAHLDAKPELVSKVLALFALGARPVSAADALFSAADALCHDNAGHLVLGAAADFLINVVSSSHCLLRTNSFDKPDDAAGSADIMLPRSYTRFANLPVKQVDMMLSTIEPDISRVDLASLSNKEDHHRLLWFALGVLPNMKLPALPQRTWPALFDWAMDSYKAAGSRLRTHGPQQLKLLCSVVFACLPACSAWPSSPPMHADR